MKHFFYLILLGAGLSALHSCKDMTDEEGNPLIDLNQNTGLNGNRALYREESSAGRIADYKYNGLNLSSVIQPMNSFTDVLWSGDKISQINFRGHLDTDGDSVPDLDSIAYTHLLTYGNQGRLSLITETRAIYTKNLVAGVPVGPYLLSERRKAEYNIKYNQMSGKMDSIIMKSGKEIAGTPFTYDTYSKAGYNYTGDNVTMIDKKVGQILAGNNEPADMHYSYEYLNYDTGISAYNLLPFAYKVSSLISTDHANTRAFILSPNSPKRTIVTDLKQPIPNPLISSTNFEYDNQNYVSRGYGIYYFYKAF